MCRLFAKQKYNQTLKKLKSMKNRRRSTKKLIIRPNDIPPGITEEKSLESHLGKF